MYKKIALVVIALAVVGVGLVHVQNAYAQSTTSPMSTLVTKIAEKFGVNKNEVQAVFDQQRTERQAEMQVRYEDRLTQLVIEGKITEAQKQLIIAKHKEIQASRQNGREAMLEWATQNGIDMQYIMGGFGMREGRGGGMGRSQ